MKDPRRKDAEDLAARIRAELLPKLKDGEFSDEEINRVIFTIRE